MEGATLKLKTNRNCYGYGRGLPLAVYTRSLKKFEFCPNSLRTNTEKQRLFN